MKKLSFFNKIFFLANTIFAVALVLSFVLPHLPPQNFGYVSLMSLFVPLLIIGNVFFVIYWILNGFKKQLFQSLIVLLAVYFFMPPLYKFNNSDNNTIDKESLSVLTYNVRKFNIYNWLDIKDIDIKIDSFISNENPDIIALQEFKKTNGFNINYPYKYNSLGKKNNYSGLVIFSKHPIINKGVVNRRGFGHNPIYIDIIKDNDTVRIYNFHLASLGLNADEDNFGYDDSEKLIKRVSSSFKVQQQQIEVLAKHIKSCKYKVVLAGDMNNTSYSWAYRHLRNDLKDSFLEAGKRSGKTYELKNLPLRIDYILTDKSIKVLNHKTYKVEFSDHFPIMASLEIK